ncbi:MAG: 50S ribosomal protein L14e [Candidatus Hydrothermarchaeales archaeon]
MDVGRVCVKIAGREAGQKCVIVDWIDENFVIIDAPGVKRRRCNLRHLEPMESKIEIKQGATTKEVEKALKKAKISLGG